MPQPFAPQDDTAITHALALVELGTAAHDRFYCGLYLEGAVKGDQTHTTGTIGANDTGRIWALNTVTRAPLATAPGLASPMKES